MPKIFFIILMVLNLLSAESNTITQQELNTALQEQKKNLSFQYQIENTGEKIDLVEGRIDNISTAVDRFALVVTIFGVLITAIVIFFSFKNSSESKYVAQEAVDSWLLLKGKDIVDSRLKPIEEDFNHTLALMQKEIEQLKKQLEEKGSEAKREIHNHIEKIKEESSVKVDTILIQYEEKMLTQSSISNLELKDKYMLEEEVKSIKIKPHNKRDYQDWIKFIFYKIAFKEYGDALNITTELLTRYKTNIEQSKLLYLQGIVYDKMNRIKNAISVLEQSIRLVPTLIYSYHKLAVLYVNSDYEKSITYARKAIKLNQDNYVAYNILSVVYRKKKELHRAKKYSFKSIEINPDYARTYYYIGSLYTELKNYDKAREFYHKAIKLDREYVVPYIGIFRLSLIENESFDGELVKEFYSKEIKHYGYYHAMLQMLYDVRNNILTDEKEIKNRIEIWSNSFGNMRFRLFGFDILEQWIAEEGDEVKERIGRVLPLFKEQLFLKKDI